MTTDRLGLVEGDRALICLNTELIAGKMMLVRGLETGMEMFVIPPSSNPLKEIPDEAALDFTALVPYQLETILKQSPQKTHILNRMKAIIVGGAPVSASLEESIQKLKVPVYLTFGMTETVSHIALRRLNGDQRSEYFHTLDGITVRTDERGCLIIDYLMNSAPIVTNDLVEIAGSNSFRWLGRIDHVINSGGIKIHPEKTERQIEEVCSLQGIDKRFFITGFPDLEFGEVAALVIEDQPWGMAETSSFLEEVKKRLHKYEVPKHLFFVPQFKETPSGKVDRHAIKRALIEKAS